ncbi:MAG TPA: AgmX/PglI C-terminal domain-containing protein [Polyangiaceae bacterium]|jgi:hypothetical protein
MPIPFARTAVVVSLLAAACGGEEPPPKPPVAKHEPPQKAVPLVAKTSSELGSVDPAAVKRAFAALDEKYMDCQRRALDRVEVLAGTVKVFLRIAPDGSTKWTYLEESDLGDRETEKCLLDVIAAAQWPKPDGGDAEVRHSFELPLQAARPPSDWSSDKVSSALDKSGEAIDKCKAGADTSYRATLYVGPGGKILSAGIATSTKEGEARADCLSKALMKMKGLPSPGSWPAKVTFGL